MNTLKTTLQDRMKEVGYEAFPEFYHAEKIVFEKDGKKYLHTFNYLGQEYALEKYLELNDNCIEFNKEFYYERQEGLTDVQKQWLVSHDFLPIIDHVFTNKHLEIDFYPQLKGYPIKDKENNHYLLASVQWYQSDKFFWLRLFKYFQPYFSFPMWEYYIKNWK